MDVSHFILWVAIEDLISKDNITSQAMHRLFKLHRTLLKWIHIIVLNTHGTEALVSQTDRQTNMKGLLTLRGLGLFFSNTCCWKSFDYFLMHIFSVLSWNTLLWETIDFFWINSWLQKNFGISFLANIYDFGSHWIILKNISCFNHIQKSKMTSPS